MYFDQNLHNPTIKNILDELNSKRIENREKKEEIKKFSLSNKINPSVSKVLNNTLRIDIVDTSIRQNTLIKFLMDEPNTTICEKIVTMFHEIYNKTSEMVNYNYQLLVKYFSDNNSLVFEKFPIILDKQSYENYYRMSCLHWFLLNTKFDGFSLEDSNEFLDKVYEYSHKNFTDFPSDKGITFKATHTIHDFLKNISKASAESKCLYVAKNKIDKIIEKDNVDTQLENEDYFRFSYMNHRVKGMIEQDQNALLLEIFIGINMRDQRKILGDYIYQG